MDVNRATDDLILRAAVIEAFDNDYYSWYSAPETICPHWIGLDCELIEKEIDFKALERYLIKVCKDE